jgi:hypothetical protein
MSVSIGPRVAALLSAAFALFLFLGVASINVPLKVSDQEMLDWWSKSGHQVSAIASMYFVAISAVAFALFVSYLREQLNGDSGTSGNAVYALGLAFAVLLLVAAATRGAIGTAVKVNGEPLPGVDTLRYVPQLGYAFMNIALITGGACLLVASWAIKRTGALPRWFMWTSVGAGVLVLVATPVFGSLTLPVLWVWALAASVSVWRLPVAPAPVLSSAVGAS